MRFSAIPTHRYLSVILCLLALSACGGGSGGPRPEVTGPLPLPLLPGHGLTVGEITVLPGQSMEYGNVVISCPAGGQACVVNVAADGSASYARAGGMPALQILPLMAGTGLNVSDASPVFAQDETDTLGAVLANPAKIMPALAATVARHYGAQRSVELSTNLYVKSIGRNQSGEYVIDYVLDGADEQVTIPMDNSMGGCPDDRSSCEVTVNGQTLSFWSITDDDDMASIQDGLGEFEYLASHIVNYRPEDTRYRTWFVFGVRNEELPMGTATYHGRLNTQTWETDDPSIDVRQFISGTMRIVANFDMRALEGRVYRIRGTEPGGYSRSRSTWPTSSFTLTNGRIVNGQFTATLTGVDSDPNTPLDESVRDFMGHVLGEFYGPDAEEVGGVVSATRDLAGTADDRVLHGFIGGRKTDRLTGVNDSKALWTGADRDHPAGSTTVTALVERPTVESTADGYRITYVVNGQTQTVQLSESDFGSNVNSFFGTSRYEKKTDGPDYIFWDETRSFISRRSFLGRFRPEHFDVNALIITHHDASDNLTASTFGYLIHGNRTTDMPTTGTADYDGGFRAREMPSDQAGFTSDASVTHYRGDFNLSANFGSTEVTGNATLLESSPGDGTYVTASGGLNFNATISGNGLSASDLSGSGDLAGYSGGRVNGAFYGPGAADGVFDATHGTQNKIITGYFGGQKQ